MNEELSTPTPPAEQRRPQSNMVKLVLNIGIDKAREGGTHANSVTSAGGASDGNNGGVAIAPPDPAPSTTTTGNQGGGGDDNPKNITKVELDVPTKVKQDVVENDHDSNTTVSAGQAHDSAAFDKDADVILPNMQRPQTAPAARSTDTSRGHSRATADSGSGIGDRRTRRRVRPREFSDDEDAYSNDSSDHHRNRDDDRSKRNASGFDSSSKYDEGMDDGEREGSSDSDYGRGRHHHQPARKRNHRVAFENRQAYSDMAKALSLPPKAPRKPGNYERPHGPMIPHFTEGNRYPFVVNKWVSVRCFGNFDEVKDDQSKVVPPAYGPFMVCQGCPSTLWPVGFTSVRLYHDFTGSGPMRMYVCTVRANPDVPAGLIWRIEAENAPNDFAEATDPTALMRKFRGCFQLIRENPIHASWLSDAEHFFGMSHAVVLDIVHCLPHHNTLLKLLKPDEPLPQLPEHPRELPKEPYSEEPNQPKKKPRIRIFKKKDRSEKGLSSPLDSQELDSQHSMNEEQSAPSSLESTKTDIPAVSLMGSTWASQPILPSSVSDIPFSPEDNSEGTSQSSSSSSATSADKEIRHLEEVLMRAEQIIFYLSETNKQQRALESVYSHER